MQPDIVSANTILEIRSGSHLYGTNTPESDEDFVGIFIAPKRFYIGLDKVEECDLSIISKDEFGKNDKFAVDRKFYEFRKFIRLAMECNPNIIEILFVDDRNVIQCDVFGQDLREFRKQFLCQMIRQKFLGYAYSQKHKMVVKPENHKDMKSAMEWLERGRESGKFTEEQFNKTRIAEWVHELVAAGIAVDKVSHISLGGINCCKSWTLKRFLGVLEFKTGQVTSRSDLWSKYGYDTKFGMHLIRLMLEGKELLSTGDLVLPLKDRELLLDIRHGKYTKEEIIQMSEQLDSEVTNIKSYLPVKPRYDWINEYLINAVENYWETPNKFLNTTMNWQVTYK
jgi:uncharacterized protein